MVLAQHRFDRFHPPMVEGAELALAVAIGMKLPVREPRLIAQLQYFLDHAHG
jgi:hypothetical protein